MPDRHVLGEKPPHRFSFGLFAAVLAVFSCVFAAEAAIDLVRCAAKANRPLAEVWPELAGSWYGAEQAGACLARASYSMLGMCLTVFLLSVPFSANFYTSKLIEVYLRDPVNRAVFALGIVTSALTHFQTSILWSELFPPGGGHNPGAWAGFYPGITLWTGVLLVAASWALLVPYAFYSLRYLTPGVIIERIEASMRRELRRATRHHSNHEALAGRLRQEIFDLGNLVLRAVERSDRDLTLDGVRALGRSYRSYLDVKADLPASWFEPRREWFTGLSEEAFKIVTEQRIWVGHLLLQQLSLAYVTALAKTPDVGAQIATIALGVAGEAARRDDHALLSLAVRVANTMIRQALERADSGVVQDVVRVHRDMVAKLAGLGSAWGANTVVEAAANLLYYHDYARRIRAHAAADVLALSLARTVELAAKHARRALDGVTAAFVKVGDPPAGVSGEALVKARALVASCLIDAGCTAEAGRLLERVAAAPPADRAAVRATLAETASRSDAGREAFGAEPGLEFIPDPRRSAVIALLDAAAA